MLVRPPLVALGVVDGRCGTVLVRDDTDCVLDAAGASEGGTASSAAGDALVALSTVAVGSSFAWLAASATVSASSAEPQSESKSSVLGAADRDGGFVMVALDGDRSASGTLWCRWFKSRELSRRGDREPNVEPTCQLQAPGAIYRKQYPLPNAIACAANCQNLSVDGIYLAQTILHSLKIFAFVALRWWRGPAQAWPLTSPTRP